MLHKLTLVLIILTPLFVCADEIEPDGKMLVTFELINGKEVATGARVIPGAIPAEVNSTGTKYRLLNANNEAISSGSVVIDRRIFHDKSTENGELIGKVSFNSNKVTVEIPWFKDTSSIELMGKNASKASLDRIIDRRTPLAAKAKTRINAPNYSEYLDSTYGKAVQHSSVLDEVKPASADLSPAAKIKVLVQNSIADLTDAEKDDLSIELSVYKTNWSLVSKKTIYPYAKPRKANLKMTSGTYNIYAVAKIGEKILYPGYQYIYNFDPSEKELKLTWQNTKMVRTSVVKSGGEKIKSKITILENDFGKTTRQPARTIVYTDENGYLEMWLPPRSFAFVIEPEDRLAAGSLLRVKKIKNKKKGSQKFKITLPELKSVGGSSVKKIWDSGPDSKKMNFIFLSEAYTGITESFTDQNGNGKWDGDLLLDENGNQAWDSGERFIDRNNNDAYDTPEPFNDLNGDQMCNRYERAEFELTAAMMTAVVMNFEPFKSYSDSINVYTYWTPSTHGAQKMPGFPAPWNSMDTYYEVECDRDDYFGDRGKFNLYSTANYSTISESVSSALPNSRFYVVLVRDPFNIMVSNSAILQSAADTRGGLVLIHEMGHKVGGLADEYVYGGDNWEAYTRSTEYHTPNLTFYDNPLKAKWNHLLNENTPVPTPPGSDGYGLFEGGSWKTGIYRPTDYSMMRATSFPFFKVNEDAIIKVLKVYK